LDSLQTILFLSLDFYAAEYFTKNVRTMVYYFKMDF